MKLIITILKDLLTLALLLAIILTYALAADALLRIAGAPA